MTRYEPPRQPRILSHHGKKEMIEYVLEMSSKAGYSVGEPYQAWVAHGVPTHPPEPQKERRPRQDSNLESLVIFRAEN